jgi:hypothetical protein
VSQPDGPGAETPDGEKPADESSADDTAVVSTGEAENETADTTNETTEPAVEAPASRRKVWLFSIAAVVVLVAAGLVAFALTRGDSTKDASGPGVPTIQDSNAPSTRAPVSPPAVGTTATITAPSSTASAAPPAGDAGNVESVAEQAATAISNADVKTLAQLSCDPSSAGEEDTFPTDATVEVIGEPQVDGETATITVRVTIKGVDPTEIPMPLTKQDGRWCIP